MTDLSPGALAKGGLAARLESAEQGSRELDEDMALILGIWRAWLSKHRYWNFEGPDGARFSWPESSITRHDPDTGKPIGLTDTPPHGWGWDADLPNWSESVDDGLALLREMGGWWLYGMGEERTPQIYAGDEHRPTGRFWAQLQHRVGGMLTTKQGCTLALALSAALIRAAQRQEKSK